MVSVRVCASNGPPAISRTVLSRGLARRISQPGTYPPPPGGKHAFAVFKPLQQLPRLFDLLDSSRPIAVYSRRLSQPDLRRVCGAPASDM